MTKVSSKKLMKWTIIAIVSALILTAVSFGGYEFGRNHGWWGESNELRELKSDPMASPDLLGLKLEISDISKTPGITGKASPVYIRHWFTVDSAKKADSTAKLIKLAEDSGWVQDESLSYKDFWLAKKSLVGVKSTDYTGLYIDSSEKNLIYINLTYI